MINVSQGIPCVFWCYLFVTQSIGLFKVPFNQIVEKMRACLWQQYGCLCCAMRHHSVDAGCETFQIQVQSDINEMLPKHLVLAENVDPNYPCYTNQVGKKKKRKGKLHLVDHISHLFSIISIYKIIRIYLHGCSHCCLGYSNTKKQLALLLFI